MKRAKILVPILVCLMAGALLGLGAYALGGWLDAARDAPRLKREAAALLARPGGLTPAQIDALLRIEDPNFLQHNGVDGKTPGAGATTITQSLAKRLAFKRFRKGLPKLRQTTYALSLERHLDKQEILALWLESASLGRGPRGWINGFRSASRAYFGQEPADLSPRQFHTLIAIGIAPGQLNPLVGGPELSERVARIERHLAGACEPLNHGDVWLDGCAKSVETGRPGALR